MKKCPLLTIILALTALLAGCSTLPASEVEGVIQASGVVEAREVAISAEQAGRVAEVFVEEGQPVQPNEPLFRLEDPILEAQMNQAKAALAVAQANYDLVAAGSTEQQRQAAIAAAQLEVIAAQQALDALYRNAEVALAEAQQAVAKAQKAVDTAQRRLNNLKRQAPQEDIDQAFANMVLAKDALDKAQKDFDKVADKPEDNLERAAALSVLAQARKEYEAAVRLYNNLTSTGNELDIAQAEADLALAQAQLEAARREVEKRRNGPDPDEVALAQARLENAQAQLALAQAESPTPEELAVAHAQIEVAQADLQAIQVLIDKLTIHAPMAGVVTTRNIDPGELIQPGLTELVISNLDELTVTVYIPESQYGRIHLGDQASVRVDSFLGETFTARVT
ncbi:MAG: HlyD family efflux transporter periplasmic adaptor subunit, partial [Anaerolineae bacterium]